MTKKNKLSLDLIKKLREETGAGIMACRQALEKADNDFDQALEELKNRHQSLAAKKANRQTEEGKVFAYIHTDGKIGALVTLLCETDFVARTQDFAVLGKELTMQVVAMSPTNIQDLLSQNYIRDPQLTVNELVEKTIAKTGENIKIGDIVRLEI
ncbi:MAG: translation elongation factor T [Microgenomates bacterium 39_6]|nr:MAG: translation elongation factor T [Microgenomates bacterium 39_6]